MLRRVVFAGFTLLGAHAFDTFPIQWGGTGTAKFILVAGDVPNSAPLRLIIGDVFDESVYTTRPAFAVKPDKTIRWHDWCVEAQGTKVGDSVGLRRCTGGTNQKFNLLPWGRGRRHTIQLEGSTSCLAVVAKESDLSGAPIILQECEDQAEGLWIFEGRLPLPDQAPSQFRGPLSRFMQHVLLSLIALAAFGAFRLRALLWEGQQQVCNVAGNGTLGMNQGGVALITRNRVFDKPNSNMNAVMTTYPSEEEPGTQTRSGIPMMIASRVEVTGIQPTGKHTTPEQEFAAEPQCPLQPVRLCRRAALAAAFTAAPVVANGALPENVASCSSKQLGLAQEKLVSATKWSSIQAFDNAEELVISPLLDPAALAAALDSTCTDNTTARKDVLSNVERFRAALRSLTSKQDNPTEDEVINLMNSGMTARTTIARILGGEGEGED